MCLAVYLGCDKPLDAEPASEGTLGFELASWRPAPLAKFAHVYYLGLQGKDGALSCTCVLAQHVDWGDGGPIVNLDPLYKDAKQCPFDTLRALVERAQSNGRSVAFVCDDSGGVEQQSELYDYDAQIISADMISAKNYLFADPTTVFPWRAFYVTKPEIDKLHHS